MSAMQLPAGRVNMITADLKERVEAGGDDMEEVLHQHQVEYSAFWKAQRENVLTNLFPGESICIDGENWPVVGRAVVEQHVDGKTITVSDIWKDTDSDPHFKELCFRWRDLALKRDAEVQQMKSELASIEKQRDNCALLFHGKDEHCRELRSERDALKAGLAERSDECLALQDKIAKLIEAKGKPDTTQAAEPKSFPANALRF